MNYFHIIKSNHTIILCCIALVLNLFFFFFNQNILFFDGLLLPQAEIAYNLYKNNNIKVNSDRLAYLRKAHHTQQRLINYNDIDHNQFGLPTVYRSVNDTIGYGILLGLLWKLTGSLKYRDIQLLQIIIFSLLIILVYQIGYMFLAQHSYAFASCIALLCFSPLIFLNVQVMRDIWGYYGLIILLYALLRAYYSTISSVKALSCAFFFTLCQWIRPTIFPTFVLLSLFIIAYTCWNKNHKKTMLKLFALFWIINISCFWIPFITYNKIAYKQYFVSTAGQDLMEGLGEFKNPYDFIMDDDWFATYMKEQYNLELGTPECHTKAYEVFITCVKEHPWWYCTTLLRRIPALFIFTPLWTNNVDHLYSSCISWQEKILCTIQHPLSLIMKIIDYTTAKLHYVELFLILGWIGVICALLHKYYFMVSILLLIAFSAASKLPSHMEPRYQIIFYWVFSFFVAYALITIVQYLFLWYNHYQRQFNSDPKKLIT